MPISKEKIISISLDVPSGTKQETQVYYLFYTPPGMHEGGISYKLQAETAEAAYNESQSVMQEVAEQGGNPPGHDFLLVCQTVSVIKK